MVVLAVVCFAEETTDLLQTAAFHRKLLSKGNKGGGCVLVLLRGDL